MATKRLFIGTFVEKSMFSGVYDDIMDEFRSICHGNWVSPANLHFTYSFLGDVDEQVIPAIKESLADYLKPWNSELVINGLGVFPNPNNPRVLHAEVFNPDKSVFYAQKQISDILAAQGFEPEARKYTPHVTLCRIKSFKNPDFRETLDSYRNFNFGKMPSFRIDLIESQLRREGPIYIPI